MHSTYSIHEKLKYRLEYEYRKKTISYISFSNSLNTSSSSNADSCESENPFVLVILQIFFTRQFMLQQTDIKLKPQSSKKTPLVSAGKSFVQIMVDFHFYST